MKWYKFVLDWEEELKLHDLRNVGRWLHLANYCAKAENGGVIEGAAKWTAKDWDRQVHARIKGDAPGLWHWRDDGALVLDLYPHHSESMLASWRKQGKRRVENRWQKAEGKNGGKAEKRDERKAAPTPAGEVADDAFVAAMLSEMKKG